MADKRHRQRAVLTVWMVCAALLFAGFAALGTWQVQRRAWKLALIARVDQRVHAPAIEAPGPALWPRIDAAADEYRHVRIAGTLLHDKAALVQANTKLGPGFWVMTPLRAADGSVVLVNRGFVPLEGETPERARQRLSQPPNAVALTGLLRLSEPGGGFLRRNDPTNGRWYSRDVQAIAQARQLGQVAPYFVDADATISNGAAPAADAPVGGLTVVSFANSHLVYAITWYALALMVAAGAWRIWREEAGKRRQGPENAGCADPESPHARHD